MAPPQFLLRFEKPTHPIWLVELEHNGTGYLRLRVPSGCNPQVTCGTKTLTLTQDGNDYVLEVVPPKGDQPPRDYVVMLHDASNHSIGTTTVRVTPKGRPDPLFADED